MLTQDFIEYSLGFKTHRQRTFPLHGKTHRPLIDSLSADEKLQLDVALTSKRVEDQRAGLAAATARAIAAAQTLLDTLPDNPPTRMIRLKFRQDIAMASAALAGGDLAEMRRTLNYFGKYGPLAKGQAIGAARRAVFEEKISRAENAGLREDEEVSHRGAETQGFRIRAGRPAAENAGLREDEEVSRRGAEAQSQEQGRVDPPQENGKQVADEPAK